MRLSILSSSAPLAPSTTICFRGPLCLYLAADRCMFSHAFSQKSYNADSPNGFTATEMEPLFLNAFAVSPHSHAFFQNSYTADSPNGFAANDLELLFPTACDDVSPQQYHPITPETFTPQNVRIHEVPRPDQSEVEPFYPAACPTTSPLRRLSKTSFTQQGENTIGLPLRINLLPAQTRT